jgi:hypothetical protein
VDKDGEEEERARSLRVRVRTVEKLSQSYCL